MKTQYELELEKRIASLETNYGYLREKVDGLGHDEDLERKLAVARKFLSKLGERGEDTWDEVKDRAEEAWSDVEKAFEKLKKSFKKR